MSLILTFFYLVWHRVPISGSVSYRPAWWCVTLRNAVWSQRIKCGIILHRHSAICTLASFTSMHELHWLPVWHHITYKLCLMVHNAHVGRSPIYITEILISTAGMPNRSVLRSSAGTNYDLPAIRHKIGKRAFSYAGPAAWNSLPNELRSIGDTQTFKTSLKCLYSN